MHDTEQGVHALAMDVTAGETGSMTAGPANGYSQLLFQPWESLNADGVGVEKPTVPEPST